MRVVTTIKEVEQFVSSESEKEKIIGLVPTMGSLHQGHLSLVSEAAKKCDSIIVSVFVNPTQFNNAKDLERYPRDLNKDVGMLSATKCDLIFAPSVEEVYPEEDIRQFNFGELEICMEGVHRPGHFNGVAQVVSKLFEMVKPDKAYFGLKDFQQLAIIRNLVTQLKSDIEIVSCPIIREDDGLAMSSRNQLLTPENRKNAPVIAATLFESCNFVPTKSVKELTDWVIAEIDKVDGLQVEYFDIVDGLSLQKIDKWSDSDYIVGCIAVFADKIRLIDNIVFKNYHYEY